MGVIKALFITIELWVIGRFLPAFIQGLFQLNSIQGIFFVRAVLFEAMLFPAWGIAKKISNGKHSTSIDLNLFLFLLIEGSSIFKLVSYMMDIGLNAYLLGMTTSEMSSFITIGLIFSVLYCGTAIWMIKKTPSERKSEKESISNEINDNVKELSDKDLFLGACELAVSTRFAEESTIQEVLGIDRSTCKALLERMDKEGITEYDKGLARRKVKISAEEWQQIKSRKAVLAESTPSDISINSEKPHTAEKLSKKESVETTDSGSDVASKSTIDTPVNNNQNHFCRYCGAKLADDSLFCSKCGKPITTQKHV